MNWPAASRWGIQMEFYLGSLLVHSFIPIRCAIGIIPFGHEIPSFGSFSLQISIHFVLEI